MDDAKDPVAVIGGGIAGAAACLRLCALGRLPLWIAPRAEAADKPGEHLAPAARGLLARIDAGHLLDSPRHREANSMLSAWGSERIEERNAILQLQGAGTVLDRPAFEADLTSLALTRGARRMDASVDRVARASHGWRITAGGEDISAKFVIDASGRAAVLARDQGQRFRADQLSALVIFLEQDAESDVEPTRATLVEAVAEGWWYASLLADGRLAVNFFTDPDLVPRGATRDVAIFKEMVEKTLYINRWITEAGFRLEESPSLVSAGTTWIAPAAGADWAAVGDASAAFDPLSSFGMTTALWTAITAAEGAVGEEGGARDRLQSFVEKVAVGVQNYLEAREKVYAMEERFREAEFWRRR